jgi:predicted O-methyltransferase YrrM
MSQAISLDSLPDARVRAALSRLHAEADGADAGLKLRFLPLVPRLLLGRTLPWHDIMGKLGENFLALDRKQGLFCYLLARASGARRIVEFGTSFGVSTIYLALAVRDNGGGRVIGTEIVESKAERARRNLDDAGLGDFVEIREGDALQTLRDVDGEIDFLLNDGFPPYALPVLKLLAPRLRVGAVVVADNVGAFPADHAPYVHYLREPGNGFMSLRLPLNEGTELSVKLR